MKFEDIKTGMCIANNDRTKFLFVDGELEINSEKNLDITIYQITFQGLDSKLAIADGTIFDKQSFQSYEHDRFWILCEDLKGTLKERLIGFLLSVSEVEYI